MVTAVVMSTTCDSPAGPEDVAFVEVTPATWSPTALGDTTRFTAVAKTALGRTIPGLTFTWSSDPQGVVGLQDGGLASAHATGSTQVRASIGDVRGTAQVSVSQTVESVVILTYFGNTLSALGDSTQLYVDARDRNSFSVPGTIYTLQSLNPTVATVTLEGWVKAVSPGVANIVAMAAGKADTAPFLVIQQVASIELSPDSAVLEDGATRQFSATLKDRNGYLITDRDPDWSSSEPLALSVSASGLATARAAKLGPAKVVARSGSGRVEAPVYVFTPFATVATGFLKTCAVSARGRPYCWGLIDDTTHLRSTVPLERTASPELDSIGAGYGLSCGLTSGGTVYCWGDPPFGTTGAAVASPPTFSSLSVGTHKAYGLTASGDAYSWTPLYPTPALVTGGLSFTSLHANYNACGIVSGGAAYCWGNNFSGQVGDSTNTERTVPTAVGGGHTFRSVVPGGSHTCGITTTGSTYCWGFNLYGQFGDSTNVSTSFPVPAAGGLALTSLTLGVHHSCGLVASGAAFCWGAGYFGSLGNGTFTDIQFTPVPVSGGLTFASISAGSYHTCGLTNAGALFCWGRNADGELGNGALDSLAVPTLVAGSRP